MSTRKMSSEDGKCIGRALRVQCDFTHLCGYTERGRGGGDGWFHSMETLLYSPACRLVACIYLHANGGGESRRSTIASLARYSCNTHVLEQQCTVAVDCHRRIVTLTSCKLVVGSWVPMSCPPPALLVALRSPNNTLSMIYPFGLL